MLISIIILGILLISYLRGAKRGFIQMLLDLVVGLVLIVIASWAAPIAGKILQPLITKLFSQSSLVLTNQLGYWLGYLLIFLLGGAVVNWFFRMFSIFTWITKLPVVHGLNTVIGGILAIIFSCLLIYISLRFLKSWPNVELHQAISNSPIAQLILQWVPNVTNIFFN